MQVSLDTDYMYTQLVCMHSTYLKKINLQTNAATD